MNSIMPIGVCQRKGQAPDVNLHTFQQMELQFTKMYLIFHVHR